jgi:hypothetical protein
MTIQRNTLAPAYDTAEELYGNAIEISTFLDAWSRSDRAEQLPPAAADHLRHNLINAQAHLKILCAQLAAYIPAPEPAA